MSQIQQALESSPQSRPSRSKSMQKPSEDWTKIADRTERRRIQNRISQRKYREKIRMRHQSEADSPSSSSVVSDQIQDSQFPEHAMNASMFDDQSQNGSGDPTTTTTTTTLPLSLPTICYSSPMQGQSLLHGDGQEEEEGEREEEEEQEEEMTITPNHSIYLCQRAETGTNNMPNMPDMPLGETSSPSPLDAFSSNLSPWVGSFEYDLSNGSSTSTPSMSSTMTTSSLFHEPTSWNSNSSHFPSTPYYLGEQESLPWPASGAGSMAWGSKGPGLEAEELLAAGSYSFDSFS